MKGNLIIWTLLFFTVASGELPKKQPGSRYARLWLNSPFTTKPVVEQQSRIGLEQDWALAGVSQLGEDRFFVTIVNKKDTSVRARVTNDGSKSVETGAEGFSVSKVEVSPRDYLQTKAYVNFDGQSAWLSFDEKLSLRSKSAPVVKRPPTTTNRPTNLPIPGLNTKKPATTASPSSSSSSRPRRIIPKKR